MINKAPTESVPFATASSAKQKPDLAGWPQWMREALAYEPETRKAQTVTRVDELIRVDPANVRILSRVSARS